jgi:hypothetical protein
MPRIPVPLGPTSDSAKSKQAGGSTLVNCYAEKTEGGKSQYSINTDPGLLDFSEMTDPLRGIYVLDNNFYVLSGENLYTLSSTGVQTLRGTILGSAPVIWSTNRKAPNNQVTITADTTNYYVENNVVAEVTDADLPAGVHSNCYLNGMTVYGLNDGRLFYSDNNETSSIDALHFTEAERSADKGMRVFTNGDEIWYFGAASLEIFHDTGITDARLEPQQNLSQGEGAGTVAKNSVAIVDSSVFWVSDALLVVRGAPYFPQRVSNHAVERDIDAAIVAGFNNEIIAFPWTQEGHQFYHLRCPLWCWVYDTSTSTWHKKENHDGASWRNAFYAFAFNKHLVGDYTSGKVYEYTFDAMDEAGDPLTTKIVSSIVHDFPNGMICDALHVDLQAGVGRAGEADHIENPVLLLRTSRDGGMTYGTEYQQPMGKQGKWNTNIRFNRLGYTKGNGMTFEIRSPEPVERAVMQAFADVRRLKA